MHFIYLVMRNKITRSLEICAPWPCGFLVHGASESSRLIASMGQAHRPPPIKLLQWSSSSVSSSPGWRWWCGGDVEGWSGTSVAPAMLSRIPPACRCLMMKMWVAFASSVLGLVLSALSVSDMMTCICLVGKSSGRLLHRRRHVGGVWLRLVGAWTMSMMLVWMSE
jgi:hypothetical protein